MATRYTKVVEKLRSASKKYENAAILFGMAQAIDKSDKEKIEVFIAKYNLLDRTILEKDWEAMVIEEPGEGGAEPGAVPAAEMPNNGMTPEAKYLWWKEQALLWWAEKEQLKLQVSTLTQKLGEAEEKTTQEREARLYKLGLERGGLWRLENQLDEKKDELKKHQEEEKHRISGWGGGGWSKRPRWSSSSWKNEAWQQKPPKTDGEDETKEATSDH